MSTPGITNAAGSAGTIAATGIAPANEVRFEAVTVRFGRGRRAMTAVDGVDLLVPAGRVVGLVGESGSGKSTLARAAVGLVPLDAGHILLNGAPLPRKPRAGQRRPLQMVFQDPYSSLDPRMTIGETIAESIPRGVSPAERRAEVARLLGMVQLAPDRARTYPGQLSGGQRQRVALARALAARPSVLIADEITSALDVSIQGTVLNLVRELQQQMQLSMLFISHNLAVVRYVSDIIAVMYLGRIVECGPADELLADPQHPYTRELLAAAPRPDGSLLDDIGAGTGSSGTDDSVAGSSDTDGPTPGPELAAVRDAEPADPHHPPPGCRFHPRCPIGPLVLPDRDICRTEDPPPDPHRHRAACHFAASADRDDPRSATTQHVGSSTTGDESEI